MLHCAAATVSLPSAVASPRGGHASALRRPLQCGGVAQRGGESNRSRPRAVLVAQRRGTSSSRLAATSGQASEQSIYAEDGPHGQYFEAVVTDFIRTRSGAVLKLLCTPRCAGLNAEQRCAPSNPRLLAADAASTYLPFGTATRAPLVPLFQRWSVTLAAPCTRSARREFPVLMDAACATETASAADRGGLPAALSSLEDLHQKVSQQPCLASGSVLYFDALCCARTYG